MPSLQGREPDLTDEGKHKGLDRLACSAPPLGVLPMLALPACARSAFGVCGFTFGRTCSLRCAKGSTLGGIGPSLKSGPLRLGFRLDGLL